MTDLNAVTIHGRIVRNAEFSTTDSGLTITRFAIASNKTRKLQNGEWVDDTTYVPLALFDKRAMAIGPYLRKGRGITVQGHIKLNRWEKDGEKRSELSVVVDNILFDPVLKKPDAVQQNPQPVQNNPVKSTGVSVAAENNEEFPFEEPPFMNEEDFFSNAELDFPPPEVTESFEIF